MIVVGIIGVSVFLAAFVIGFVRAYSRVDYYQPTTKEYLDGSWLVSKEFKEK